MLHIPVFYYYCTWFNFSCLSPCISLFQAQIDQWIDFSSLEIDANIMKLYLPRLGFATYFPPVSCVPMLILSILICFFILFEVSSLGY